MKRSFAIILLVLLSCKNTVDITETEVNAVQEVLNYYNGKCLRSKGFDLKNGVNLKNFELEMSDSELLEHNADNLKFDSGNIAYLFYSNLNNEKSNYDEIKVKINLKNGNSQNYKYTSQELLEIENLQPQINKINELILSKNYEELALQFENSVKIDKESIAALFAKIEKQYGAIKKTQFQGFDFKEINNFGQITVIKQALVLDKINASMIMAFKRNGKLITIEFP